MNVQIHLGGENGATHTVTYDDGRKLHLVPCNSHEQARTFVKGIEAGYAAACLRIADGKPDVFDATNAQRNEKELEDGNEKQPR